MMIDYRSIIEVMIVRTNLPMKIKKPNKAVKLKVN